MELRKSIETALKEHITGSFYGSGKIVTDSGRTYFVKSGPMSRKYSCEANGLIEIAASGTISVPEVIAVGENFIVTEFIQNSHPANDFFQELGRRLADIHRTASEHYGFREDNFIGDTPQPNIASHTEKYSWAEFYWNKRLLFQYRLAEQNGYATPDMKKRFLKLEKIADRIITDAGEKPALLHGDLWAGNYLCGPGNRPYLIDPAVYYGHREADLAMTKLFGGFGSDFYSAYMEKYPLCEGWEYRENIYILYHVLNHMNLFGRGYYSHAMSILSRYIS
ncbi:MAG: fructosamine kinase family protein [Rikenellaceae bacterium]|nr:fructosamine kinase family protein [Rikenellaceae bacterium]